MTDQHQLEFADQQKQQRQAQEAYYFQIAEAVGFLEKKLGGFKPYLALALGSGVGELAEDKEFKVEHEFDYQNIPYFPTPSVAGHKGKLIFAAYKGVPLVILQGRVHAYEILDLAAGPIWGARMATLPWYVMKGLGVQEIITTHACGGYAYSEKAEVKVGDLGIIFDHTNLLGFSPLLGLNDERLGGRFMGKGQVLDGAMAAAFVKGVKPGRYHLAHYITTCSAPNYEGMGDIDVGLLAKEIASTNPEVVACFGMSMSFEADVINHANVPSKDKYGLDRKVKYLPIGLISNVVPKQRIPTLKDLAQFAPNPTSHEEVLAAQQAVMANLLPGLLSYLKKLAR
jgi:purine-nucleoside phosphorylase